MSTDARCPWLLGCDDTAMLDAWLDFSVLLYGVIGPTISVGPFMEAFLTMDTRRPLWASDAGYAAKIALTLDLWFQVVGLDPIRRRDPAGRPGTCHRPHRGLQHVRTRRRCGPRAGVSHAGPNGDTRTFSASRFRLISAGEPLSIVPMALPSGQLGAPIRQRLRAAGVRFSMITGEFRDDRERDGCTLEGEELTSPGPTLRVPVGAEVTNVQKSQHGRYFGGDPARHHDRRGSDGHTARAPFAADEVRLICAQSSHAELRGAGQRPANPGLHLVAGRTDRRRHAPWLPW